MNDLIERQEAIGIIDKEIKHYYPHFTYDSHSARNALDIAKLLIENYVPSAQHTGRWEQIKKDSGGLDFRCSSCRKFRFHNGEMRRKYKYCPNCGARMEVDDNDNP